MKQKKIGDPALDAAVVLHRAGKYEQAAQAYQKILKMRPTHSTALTNLGSIQRRQGNFQAARESFERALKTDPKNGHTWINLCNLHLSLGLNREAIEVGREAVKYAPTNAIAFDNLGYALYLEVQLPEAEQYLLQALKLNPEFANAWNNLGALYQRQNRLAEAALAYQHAVQLNPSFTMAFSNLLFCMHFGHQWTREAIFQTHLQWAQRFEAPLLTQPALTEKGKSRLGRLPRVGFISPDLYQHPVADFLRPLIAHWPHAQFDLCFFASVKKTDHVSDWLKDRASLWCDIYSLNDEAAARKVAEHNIDILIDLTGHTGGGRLLVMAHRPAPVQINWLGYFDTLGMQSVDYILADPICVPSELEHLFVEKVLRMPHGFACYDAPTLPIAPGPLPARTNGYVTFGSQNQLAKVTDEVLALWCELLRRIPTARLHFQAKAFNDDAIKLRYLNLFQAAGIETSRIDFLPSTNKTGILNNYRAMDIALDPFPCAGGTTTCESLWMGVPVITLLGDRFGCRHSASHLNNVGLQNCIATNAEQYLQLAQSLAADIDTLENLRAELRANLIASPLCDGALFARHFAENLQRCLNESDSAT
jgi:protein O-GlcNAc transferase